MPPADGRLANCPAAPHDGAMGIIGAPPGVLLWTTPTPDLAGVSPEADGRLEAAFSRGEFSGLHGLLVIRNGRLALERYFEGEDEHWGQPLGKRRLDATLLHDVRSVTKSVVSLLYGVALSEGFVPPVRARLVDQFPAYPEAAADPRKRRITLAHVLSMRMGLAWNEDLTYDDPNNGEREMEAAADRYAYILGRPMVERPGSRWVYCGGSTALLGRLIEQGTGRRLEDYAHDRLFRPLGIDTFEWVTGSDGRAAASSGLRLRSRDLARIGQMVLDRGLWLGKPIIPAGWLASSFKPRCYVESGLRYGYQWWIGTLVATGKPWHAAFGNGGQRLIVIPSLRMVVVILAGNYNAADQWKMPVRLMTRIVMPAVMES